MAMAGIAIDDIVLYTYFSVGGLFLFYFFFIFVQKKIHNGLRLSLSFSFGITGMFIMGEAGKILTGYKEHFTISNWFLSIILAVIGLLVVSAIHKMSNGND